MRERPRPRQCAAPGPVARGGREGVAAAARVSPRAAEPRVATGGPALPGGALGGDDGPSVR